MPDWLDKSIREVQDAYISGFQHLPEPIKRPIRQAVGRVATNIIIPFGYGLTHDDPTSPYSKAKGVVDLIRAKGIGKTLKSVIEDKPLYSRNDINDPAAFKTREPLYREFFDLPSRYGRNVFTHQGKQYRVNPDTTNPVGQSTLRRFRADAMVGANNPAFSRDGVQRWNPISANYIQGQPDPWDFDPHPDELAKYRGKPLNTELFGRSLFQALGRPAVLQTAGYWNPAPRDNMIPRTLSFIPAANF